MKADIKRTVIIEMSYEEAAILRALVGGVGRVSASGPGGAWAVVTGIWAALTSAGVDGGGMKFSDLFEGEVSVK